MFASAAVVLSLSLVAAPGDAPAKAKVRKSEDNPGLECAQRVGGAFILFRVNDETLLTWVTNGKFIDDALAQRGKKAGPLPLFKQVVDGADCDPRWTWHVDPAAAEFTQLATEVCDGRPSDVEKDKKKWIADVKRYCPWSARVVSVDDRRTPAATADEIAVEVERQRKGATPLAMNAATATQQICTSSPVPAGWIKTNDSWDPTRCGNPSSISYNITFIEQFETAKVGAVMEVCASAATPTGWVDVSTRWDPTRCGHPSSISSNMKTIKRLK